MAKNNIGSRLSEQATRHVPSDKKYNEDSKARIEALMKEPKIRVHGNPMYAQFLGDFYSFDYQDFPVTIKFDGTWQEYPETIGKLLIKKLDAAAISNTAKEAGLGTKL